jgi:hypothetical protein
MNDINKNVIRNFRKSLFEDVYNVCIRNLNRTIKGETKSPDHIVLYNKLKHIDKEGLLAIKELCKEYIESTVHYLLWMIEQSDDLDLIVRKDDEIISLKDISDGLCGELSYVLGGYDESFPLEDKMSD